jgi:hypothetical protein
MARALAAVTAMETVAMVHPIIPTPAVMAVAMVIETAETKTGKLKQQQC